MRPTATSTPASAGAPQHSTAAAMHGDSACRPAHAALDGMRDRRMQAAACEAFHGCSAHVCRRVLAAGTIAPLLCAPCNTKHNRYQVCLFCFQRINNVYTASCPGCRQPYGDNTDEVKPHVKKRQEQEVVVRQEQSKGR